MIDKEDWNTILEREGISDFLHAYYYEEVEGVGIYETDNDYYGVIFKVFAPPFPGAQTEEKVQAFLGAGFPIGTNINFFTMARSNIQENIRRFINIHSYNKSLDKVDIDNPEFLRIITEEKVDWLKKYANKSIFEKVNLEYNLRSFTSLITVMIPAVDVDGKVRKTKDMVTLFQRAKVLLDDFSPQYFAQHEYITLMQEILNPHNPLWTPPVDRTSPIKEHLFNSQNTMKIEKDGTLSVGTLKEVLSQIDDHEIVEEEKTFLDNIKEMFSKTKQDDDVVREDRVIDKKSYVKMLGKKMFPYYLSISEVADLINDFFASKISPLIPCPFFISLSIKIEDIDKITQIVNDDVKWNKYQLSMMGKMAEYSPDLMKRAQEADMVIQELDNDKVPMKSMWTMGIIHKDKNVLEGITSKVMGEFKQRNWIIQEENIIPLPVFLYSLPLQFDEIYYDFSKKFSTLFDSNVSSLAPLFADSRGFGEEYVYYIGRNGQIQGFNLFDRSATNKVFTIVAPPGGGKSFMTNDIIVSYLDVGTTIRILDKGNSYKNICEMLGGEYIVFSNDIPMNFNFLTNPMCDEDGSLDNDEISKFVAIVAKMAGIDVSPSNDDTPEISSFKSVIASYLVDAIRGAWAMGGEKFDVPGMQEIRNSLIHLSLRQNEMADKNIRLVDEKLRDMIVSLKRFAEPEGEYYEYFNGRSNIEFSKDFVVFEMGELDQKGELFKDLVIMTVVNDIRNEFINGDRGKKKIMLIDEAWDLLKNKTTAGFIDLAARTFRKHNAALGVITQSINDFFMNQGVQVIFETAGWKIFLEQNDTVLRKAIDDKRLMIDEFTYRLISSIETKGGLYGEVLIMSYKGAVNIGRLIVSRSVYWLFTSDAQEFSIIAQMAAKHKIPAYVAAYTIGKVEENNTSFEVELERYQEKHQDVELRKITDELEDILDEVNDS